MCFKYYEAFSVQPTAMDVAIALEKFAESVDSGKYNYTPEDLAQRYRKMAQGEREIDAGNKKLALSTIYWAISFLVIAVLQALFIREAYKIIVRNKHITSGST